MSKPQSERELTSTLHLGLRSVVGNSPADLIETLLQEASSEEREVIEGIQAGGADSAMVIIHRGPQKGARFLIDAAGVAIGRAPDSSIFLDDVTVSRKHATITKSGDSFIFTDNSSLNGSYINNQPVAEHRLSSGEEIQIGKFHLLFICADASQGEK